MKATIILLVLVIIGATFPQSAQGKAQVGEVQIGSEVISEAETEQTFVDGEEDVIYSGGPRVLGYGVGSRNF